MSTQYQTNLVPNPSFEKSTAGWTATNASISRVAAPVEYEGGYGKVGGDYALKVVCTTAGDIVIESQTGLSGMPVAPSNQYFVQSAVMCATNTLRDIDIGWNWFTSAGAGISAWSYPTGPNPSINTWWAAGTDITSVPATAAFASMRVLIRSAAVGEVFYIDACMFADTNVTGEVDGFRYSYFDGDTDGFTWNGAPHNSTSSTEVKYTPTISGDQNLRLEIEVPTEGLPNLINNPNGELGGWGWVTPVNNTTMVGMKNSNIGSFLRLNNFAAQAVYFTSEFLPATAGKYYGARVDLVGITSGYNIKGRFEWYNSSKVLLSSSTQTTAFTTIATTYYIPGVVAPAGTAYVKVRYDFYNGVSNPSANTAVSMQNHMVTEAATAGGLGSQRVNLIPNPSFETNLNYWTDYNATSVRSNTFQTTGTYSIRMTAVNTNQYNPGQMALYSTSAGNPVIAATGGKTYTLQFRSRPTTSTRYVDFGIQFWDSKKKDLGWYMISQVQTTGAWKTHNVTITAPTGAAYMAARVQVRIPLNGEVHYFDSFMIEASNTLGTYFDGSTAAAGTKTYSWDGTAHNSASRETSGSDFGYSDTITWQNILGPTHDIKVTRKELDVGLLSATILDANLDPTVASFVRPGKRVRLLALADGIWETVFTGKLSNAHVVYDKEKAGDLSQKGAVRVELTASDAMTLMANQGESRGVPNIPDLPYILEGKGVPWNVNGSGNQVSSAVVVSTNDNASVADQVAITRDSKLGYAWMDRKGVLNAWDASSLGSTVACTFSDASTNLDTWYSYTDIDVDFNMESIINDVTVTWLRYTAAKGTEEITYSGYQDANSIKQWGARSANFTIHGTSESSSAIATFANNVLAKNANPVVRVNSLTMPVRNDKERARAAVLDLYDLVAVQYDTRVDTNYRVTGIEHTITPGKWMVALDFGVDQQVASPTWTPSPPTVPLSGALPTAVKANLGSKTVTATTYAAVAATNNVTMTAAKACKVQVSVAGYIDVSGTGNTDLTVKVVGSGATSFDSTTLAGANGTMYEFTASARKYGIDHMTFTVDINAGTTTFTVWAVRAGSATTTNINGLWIEVTPISWLDDYA